MQNGHHQWDAGRVDIWIFSWDHHSCLLIWVGTAIDHWSPFWSNCTICINGDLLWANNCYKSSKETVHFNVLSLQWLPIGHKLFVLFAFILLSFSKSKFLTNMKAINLLTIIWTLITIWRYNRFELHSYCATATGTELFLVWTLSSIYTQSIPGCARFWQFCRQLKLGVQVPENCGLKNLFCIFTFISLVLFLYVQYHQFTTLWWWFV